MKHNLTIKTTGTLKLNKDEPKCVNKIEKKNEVEAIAIVYIYKRNTFAK